MPKLKWRKVELLEKWRADIPDLDMSLIVYIRQDRSIRWLMGLDAGDAPTVKEAMEMCEAQLVRTMLPLVELIGVQRLDSADGTGKTRFNLIEEFECQS
jgi:hypothetical protein